MPMSADELGDMRDAFAYNDEDGDGHLSFEEFQNLLDELGAEMSGREARAGFLAIDSDHDGRVELREFIAWWQER
jgi:calmodulin